MRHVIKAIGLWLLLLVAQQGAIVHELSHFTRVNSVDLGASGGATESTCALCPAFAQVITPAFSHAFHIPSLVRAASERIGEPRYSAIDAEIPQPRSRGPPSLS
jgi:hypothetical protein